MATEFSDKLVELNRQLGISGDLAVPIAEVDAENLSKGDLALALHRLRKPIVVIEEILIILCNRIDAIGVRLEAVAESVKPETGRDGTGDGLPTGSEGGEVKPTP